MYRLPCVLWALLARCTKCQLRHSWQVTCPEQCMYWNRVPLWLLWTGWPGWHQWNSAFGFLLTITLSLLAVSWVVLLSVQHWILWDQDASLWAHQLIRTGLVIKNCLIAATWLTKIEPRLPCRLWSNNLRENSFLNFFDILAKTNWPVSKKM